MVMESVLGLAASEFGELGRFCCISICVSALWVKLDRLRY